MTSNTDIEWCQQNSPANGSIDPTRLFEEAQVLSSYEHLAALFGVSVEALTPYRTIVERARLIGEHAFFVKLKERVDANNSDAIRITADMIKLFEMNKAAPITTEEELNVDKVRDILLPQK